MPRYIDADNLIKRANSDYGGVRDAVEFARFVNDEPTADVLEVRHGKWIYTPTGNVCSICNAGWVGLPKTNFCPNCGARMNAVVKENE